MNIIEATNFGVRLGGVTLLEDISLTLAEGKPHALVGRRGSGKTLLLRALVGLWPPDAVVSGKLVVGGISIADLSETERRAARRSARLMYLPPSGRDCLNPVETIGTQIRDMCSARATSAPRHDLFGEAASVLRQLGIADPARVLEALPDELSGGMNKRVLLAMALLIGARVLAADEPTLGLDVTIQRQILDLLATVQAREGFTLVLATQNLRTVAHYASTITVLERGRVVERSTPAEFFTAPTSEAGEAMLTTARAW